MVSLHTSPPERAASEKRVSALCSNTQQQWKVRVQPVSWADTSRGEREQGQERSPTHSACMVQLRDLCCSKVKSSALPGWLLVPRCESQGVLHLGVGPLVCPVSREMEAQELMN